MKSLPCLRPSGSAWLPRRYVFVGSRCQPAGASRPPAAMAAVALVSLWVSGQLDALAPPAPVGGGAVRDLALALGWACPPARRPAGDPVRAQRAGPARRCHLAARPARPAHPPPRPAAVAGRGARRDVRVGGAGVGDRLGDRAERGVRLRRRSSRPNGPSRPSRRILPARAGVPRRHQVDDRRHATWCPATSCSSRRETGSAPTRGWSTAPSRSTCRRSPASRCRCARRRRVDGTGRCSRPCDLVFSGTTCTGGEARALVTRHRDAHRAGPHRRAVAAGRARGQSAGASGQAGRLADRGGRGRRGLAVPPARALAAGLRVGDGRQLRHRADRRQRPEGLLPTITLALAVGCP